MQISSRRLTFVSLLITALSALAATASSARAATSPLVADYDFTGGAYTSSVAGAPALTDIGVGAKSAATETVLGTSDSVMTFPAGSGLGLVSTGLFSSDFTIIFTTRAAATTTYHRLLDFGDGADDGLYFNAHGLDFYDDDAVPADNTGPGTPVSDSTWTEVAYTRAASKQVVGYLDGTQQFTYTDTFGNDDTAPATTNVRFFLDDSNENSGGAVGRIRIYNRVLSAAEIEMISAGGDPFAPPIKPTVVSLCPKGTSAGVKCTWRADERSMTFVGTSGADRMIGTGGADVMLGKGGNDVIAGGGGRDIIKGGAGRDTIWGGPRRDDIHGGRGDDTLHGGTGNDRLYGDDGDDVMYGDAGDDWFFGGAGNDLMVGGAGIDRRFNGGGGRDIASRRA